MGLKLFIVRKYVWANSVHHAVKKERKQVVDDCWLDEEWRRRDLDLPLKSNEIGFRNK